MIEFRVDERLVDATNPNNIDKRRVLIVTDYHLANLRWALGRIMAWDGDVTAADMNTGDWCGELLHALEGIDLDTEPNR